MARFGDISRRGFKRAAGECTSTHSIAGLQHVHRDPVRHQRTSGDEARQPRADYDHFHRISSFFEHCRKVRVRPAGGGKHPDSRRYADTTKSGPPAERR